MPEPRVALGEKAAGRRSRLAIFGGTKTISGRRTQKGKIFNRRNTKPKPVAKPAPVAPEPVLVDFSEPDRDDDE